jgi:hypothetical protein
MSALVVEHVTTNTMLLRQPQPALNPPAVSIQAEAELDNAAASNNQDDVFPFSVLQGAGTLVILAVPTTGCLDQD